ncbi:rhodanese-like domain-containing protein [Ideonella sp. DXS29W]|uniref:Rhodanese-like domain-containing protein n=1 Tax=Ideonella lacteola TaxID=2984193 RepID=A0ABU9BX47_9BURK
MKHPSSLPRSSATMVAEANEQVARISVDELRTLLTNDAITLLDVRETGEHAACTIPGAVCVPRGMLEFHADPASPFHRAGMAPSRNYVLFCGSGGRSALAALTLQTMG